MKNFDVLPFVPGSLTLVAARPAMGLLDYMCAAASERLSSKKVLMLTLVASPTQIMRRIDETLQKNLMIVDAIADNLEGELDHLRNLCNENGLSTICIEAPKNPYDLTKLKEFAEQMQIEIVIGEPIPMWKQRGITPNAPTIEDVKSPGTASVDNFIALHRPEYYEPLCRN